jgi:hypothetical protein
MLDRRLHEAVADAAAFMTRRSERREQCVFVEIGHREADEVPVIGDPGVRACTIISAIEVSVMMPRVACSSWLSALSTAEERASNRPDISTAVVAGSLQQRHDRRAFRTVVGKSLREASQGVGACSIRRARGAV